MAVNILKGLLLMSLVVLTACQQIEGESLLTSEKKIDTSNDVDKTAKEEELYLSLHAPSINATGKNKSDISGDCFASTFSKHEIVVTNNNVPVSIVDVNPTTPATSNKAQCKNGRFNFILRSVELGNGNFSLRVSLRAFDADGNVVINQSQAESTLAVSR